MIDARRQSSDSEPESPRPGSTAFYTQDAGKSGPEVKYHGQDSSRDSIDDKFLRPSTQPERSARHLTSKTQRHESTKPDLQERPSNSAGDEDDVSPSPRGDQTQLYSPKPRNDDVGRLPYSYKYPTRYNPVDTGTINIPRALASSGLMIPGNIATLEDRHGHAFEESETSSATRPPEIKALPTVHDHVTDRLDAERKEYIPRETDSSGETKVSKDGHPLGGRTFRCRTFQLPEYGETLFMLNTECARILGYRDSDVLFNENRSLFKIYLTYTGKAYLIERGISFYSYESEELAIVTARSMFRQFGARLIRNGRRVRDDYWEADARQQGFTEEDDASETTPGAARSREDVPAQSNHTGRRHTLWRTFRF